MKNVSQAVHTWITTYELQKKHLIIERWKKYQPHEKLYGEAPHKLWKSIKYDDLRIKGTFKMRPELEMVNKPRGPQFWFVYKLMKNIWDEALRDATFLRQVRLATSHRRSKKLIIATTMKHKATAFPTEHPTRMRTDHFGHAPLLLPKINAR